jgi:hypothetical protein
MDGEIEDISISLYEPAYRSWTGNTKKVAEAIYDVISQPKEMSKKACFFRVEDFL